MNGVNGVMHDSHLSITLAEVSADVSLCSVPKIRDTFQSFKVAPTPGACSLLGYITDSHLPTMQSWWCLTCLYQLRQVALRSRVIGTTRLRDGMGARGEPARTANSQDGLTLRGSITVRTNTITRTNVNGECSPTLTTCAERAKREDIRLEEQHGIRMQELQFRRSN